MHAGDSFAVCMEKDALLPVGPVKPATSESDMKS